MTYKLVTAISATELSVKVNEMISDGWEPHGGVAVGGDALNKYFAQAMIKRA